MARWQVFDQAKWTKDLVNTALKMFMINADELDNKLIERRL